MNKTAITLSTLALTGTTLLSSQAAAQQDEQARKELRILSGIFETVMEEEADTRNLLGRSTPEVLYLPGKGVVFTVNAGGQLFNIITRPHVAFSQGVELFAPELEVVVDAREPAAPRPPQPAVPGEADLERMQREAERMAIEAERMAIEAESRSLAATRAGRVQFYSIGEAGDDPEIREATEALASQENELAVLSEALQQARLAASEGQDQVSRLSSLRERLERAETALKQSQEKLRQAVTRSREKAAEEQARRSQAMVGTLASALCDYGSTLKSLDNDNFVAFVLDGYNGDTARVMMFEASEVKNCRSTESLLESASIYDQ